jgi:glycosyltransferase involved in cell wall biosynthesis
MQNHKIAEGYTNCISIDCPAEPIDGTPATIRVSSNHTIHATGIISLPSESIQSIRGRVNTGSIFEGRLSDCRTIWEMIGVGPARENSVNQFWLEIQFKNSAGQVVTKEFLRPFFIVGPVGKECLSSRINFSDGNKHDAAVNSTRPVRVAVATPMFRVGGVERWIADLAKWLDPERAKVTKLFITNEGAFDDIAVSWLPRWVEVVESAHIPNDESFDVILTEGVLDLEAVLSGISKPSIEVQHGISLADKRRVKLIESSVLAHVKLGTYIAGVNSLVLDNFPPNIRNSITIIENGSDPANATPLVDPMALRESLSLPPDAKVVLYVGRIAQEKNVQVMIDAVSLLGEPWHAVIVGPQFVPLLRTGPRVHLVSAKPRIGNWLGIADVLCHPSDHESHCYAVNDAWFAKVPVVACNYPANQKFHELHGELSWLVPTRPTPEVLASAIQDASHGRDDARVQRAWETAHRCYSVALMGRRWTDFLCSVVANDPD